MRFISQHRQWLLYFALALPGVLVPRLEYMGPNRVRYNLGWPIPGMDILVGEMVDGWILHFQPGPCLLIAVTFWVFVIRLAWLARRWAMDCPDWRGAAVQAL